jgi:SAM-dependent methyltransferase
MNPCVLRVLYGVLSCIGLNPALAAADVVDTRLVELVEGEHRLEPGRALDLGRGAGRNTLYLARHGSDVIGIDRIGRAVEKARPRAVGAAASARFLQGDVTKLADLDIGDGYTLLVDSRCYYGLADDPRDAFAAGVTRVAAAEALLLMSGFTTLPGTGRGIGEEDLPRRFHSWELRTSALIRVEEIMRDTRIPFPMKAGLSNGRLKIRRFELSRTKRP